MKNNKPELLAPAGNLAKMKTAFAFGADAVYLGIPDFSLRVRINDFTLPKIKEAIKYAHGIGKKVYITVNIFAHNTHIKKLSAFIKKLKELNPDGIFVSDPGVLSEVKKAWPGVKLILSTQANCTNWQAAKFWRDLGCERIILSRELPLRDIKEIKKMVPGVELECFAHGALCMAYSGRCFISKYYNDRNANLGDCSQPCRWEYKVGSEKSEVTLRRQGYGGQGSKKDEVRSEKLEVRSKKCEDRGDSVMIQTDGHGDMELVEEEHGSYIMNSEDLCTIRRLPEMIDAGIAAFKIEGRAKSVYYLGNVVGAYRRAIDLVFSENPKGPSAATKKELGFLYSELESKLFNRSFTEGFMFGQGEGAQNLDNTHNFPDWEFCGQSVKTKKIKGGYKNYIRVHNTLKIGDRVEAVIPDYEVIKINIGKMVDSETGGVIEVAHGGAGGKTVVIEHEREISRFSVLRRRKTCNS